MGAERSLSHHDQGAHRVNSRPRVPFAGTHVKRRGQDSKSARFHLPTWWAVRGQDFAGGHRKECGPPIEPGWHPPCSSAHLPRCRPAVPSRGAIGLVAESGNQAPRGVRVRDFRGVVETPDQLAPTSRPWFSLTCSLSAACRPLRHRRPIPRPQPRTSHPKLLQPPRPKYRLPRFPPVHLRLPARR